jgi:hypothetical protein
MSVKIGLVQREGGVREYVAEEWKKISSRLRKTGNG